ncbi:MAG: hypothetical protein MJY77_03220, partial [Bacteroidaceae bacterium]|nr:hypothetical protein [Bacteroidaceae bacterium]
ELAIEEATAEALERGLLEGLAKGKAEGKAEGALAANLEAASRLKSAGVALDIICQCTGLTFEQVQEL